MRLVGVALVLLVCSVFIATSRSAWAQGTPDQISRGRYLVMSAGRCNECHGDALQGAPLNFLKPGLPVVYRAPKIAGLDNLSVAAATTFLQTGKLPNGRQALPPMPAYRFDRKDASAIVAYLKSLK